MAALDTENIWPISGFTLGASAFDPLPGTPYVVPHHFEVSFGDQRLKYDVVLEVLMDDAQGPICLEIHARQRPDEAPVTQLGLRSIPITSLLQQAARFMAYEVTEDEDGTVQYSPMKASLGSREAISKGWRLARAAPRRRAFPPTTANLRLIGQLVEEALEGAKESGRRPTVYADVKANLLAKRHDVSRTTVQRRIEESQKRGFAPRWTKEDT
jgi:hypothetical protein